MVVVHYPALNIHRVPAALISNSRAREVEATSVVASTILIVMAPRKYFLELLVMRFASIATVSIHICAYQRCFHSLLYLLYSTHLAALSGCISTSVSENISYSRIANE